MNKDTNNLPRTSAVYSYTAGSTPSLAKFNRKHKTHSMLRQVLILILGTCIGVLISTQELTKYYLHLNQISSNQQKPPSPAILQNESASQSQSQSEATEIAAISSTSTTPLPSSISTSTLSVVPTSHIKLCFTPASICAPLIIEAIDNAKESIYMQAYSFTHQDIAASLVSASERGVAVKLLLDKSNITQRHSKLSYIQKAAKLGKLGIDISIDHLPGIAHNKVVVIDQHLTLTGSYNFSNASDAKNAENLLVIDDSQIAKLYIDNWNTRKEENDSKNVQYKRLHE